MLHTLKNRIKQNKWLYTFLTNHKRNEEILERTRQALHRTTPQAFLKLVDVDIASHCNLNCYSCDHFSQLAEASFYDLAQYRKDMERLSALTQAMVEKIRRGAPAQSQMHRILRHHAPILPTHQNLYHH